jgi:hypothetical protein
VHIPFVSALAELMPAGSTRLRRDFVSMLCLIRANALLHQATRERDAAGRILATAEQDDAIVRALIGEIVAEGVAAGVSDAVRETVEAVQTLLDDADHVTPSEVQAVLQVGRSATYNRIKHALNGGLLTNDSPRNERGMRLMAVTPLPGAAEYLPTVADVVHQSSRQAVDTANPLAETHSGALSDVPPRPRFGEPGYPMVVNAAFAGGHITEAELMLEQRLHTLIRRRDRATA